MRRLLLVTLGLACGCGGPSEPALRDQNVVVHAVTNKDAGTESAPVVDPKKVPLLPLAEALPIYRAWAVDDDPAFAIEGLSQLAWAKDPVATPLFARALGARDHAVRATAARAIVELAGEWAKPVLTKALAEASPVDRAEIVWALVVLRDPAVIADALKEHRAGTLEKVERLDGTPAFELHRLAALVPADRARELGVAILARHATTIPPELTSAIASADAPAFQQLVEELATGAGGKGLVLALGGVAKGNSDRSKFQTKAIFDRLRVLADPGAADVLASYLDAKPEPHWKTVAATRLAEIGDLRAVPALAWRMTQDPLTLYGRDMEEYRRDDNERVVAARMLADLAVLYPDQRADIRKQAHGPVHTWLTTRPQPHANGLRFMAAAEAKEELPLLRKWANPKSPFPQVGQQDFPTQWATAQSALRYLGWMKDPASWAILEQQLGRRPEKVDATLEALLQGGYGVLGMTLRSIGVGASQGFAQWGDPKAYPLLVKYIEDQKNNEQSRLDACASLAWVATDAQMIEVAGKVKSFSAKDPKTEIIRNCYLETLIHRPVPSAAAALLEFLDGKTDLAVQHSVARAIGRGGMTSATVAELVARLSDPAVRNDAALALLLGADADTARRTLLSFESADPSALEELKVNYSQTFGYWSDADIENGNVARWLANAEAASRAKLRGARQEWMRGILAHALSGIDYDNGPRSVTRVQLRVRLLRDLRGSDEKKHAEVLRLFRFMNEKGALM